jgi:predicted Zn-dependent protease
MKKIFFTLIVCFLLNSAYSQVLYDNGPIISGNNFVTVGSWGRTNITYRFVNGTSDLSTSDQQNAVRQAFQIWADYAPLTFTEVTSNEDISIRWATGDHGDGGAMNVFDGANGVLAHAFFPNPNNATGLAGDLHFDDDETWTISERASSLQPMDLVSVAAHEIGHTLGLDHSNVTCALMNPFYFGSHRYLAQDDIDGIRSLYGNRSPILHTGVTCSGGTYYFNNVPTGGSVTWQIAPSNVATVTTIANQGIVSRVGSNNGDVVLTGSLTLPCGIIVTENASFNIGAIPVTDISITLPIGVDPDNLQCLTVYKAQSHVAGGAAPTGYQWGINSDWALLGSTTNSNVNFLPNPAVNTNGYVTLIIQNACGWSNEQVLFMHGDCNSGFRVGVSPNPVKTESFTTITLEEIKDLKMASNEKINFVLFNIYTGQIVKKWALPGGQTQYRLNLTGVKRGQYILQTIVGKVKKAKPIMIE